ncbi:MAG: flagellar motor switch protein FliN [Syntrophales bacterium]|nr:flagellar motor switch protein FliN [Syntrophales bacterium]
MSGTDEKNAIEDIDWSDVQDDLNASREMAAEQRAAQETSPKSEPSDKKPKAEKELPKREVSPMDFGELKGQGGSGGALDLDFILVIPLKVSAELGRSKMLVGDLLSLGQGSIVELDKAAGEPVDVFVNNRLIARGEVVVTNEKFGVRLTDVVSHSERVNNLR